MTVPRYITLAGGNRLSLQDLVEQIFYVIEEDGLQSLRLKNTLQFYDEVDGVVGGLKYDSTIDAVVYSTDGGTTWNPITSDSFWWTAGKLYTTGTVVLHTSGWYVCQTGTREEPGQSAAWVLLTSGSIIKYVRNSAQLKAALEARESNITIILRGDVDTAFNAQVTAHTVAIWSDEASRVMANITLSTSAGTNIYWHANGTRVTSTTTINCTPGYLYIDRLRVTYGSLALQGNCIYQKITGTFSGGTQEWWELPSFDQFLEKDLSKLIHIPYSAGLKVFVNSSNNPGYIAVEDIAAEAAKYSFQYFKIHKSAPLEQRPETAVAGYVFYATDTGDLYIMDSEGSWGPAVHFRGPEGKSGTDGSVGYTLMPTVSDEGILSWEAKVIPITEAGPAVPDAINIKGPSGASAFDIWKAEVGNESSTVEDYLQALGLGSRKTLFTAADVNNVRQLILNTTYPVIGIEDNDGYQWILPDKAIQYIGQYAHIDLTSIYEARGMLARGESITTEFGAGYTRVPIEDLTEPPLFAWGNSSLSIPYVYTESLTPAAADTCYYYDADDVTNEELLQTTVYAYIAAKEEESLPGNWYAMLSCGGGNDGKSVTTEIVAARLLELGQDAYVKDISVPSFQADGIIFVRDQASDTAGLYAWRSGHDVVVYTDTTDVISGETLCYTTVDKTTSFQITAYQEKSTSTVRRYEIGIPEGPEGTAYGIPEAFDNTKTYYPVSHDKRSYDTVIHQGGTWIYKGTTASTGNYPPALPTTENDYWKLMAAPGADGVDVGTGITTHKLELRKPISNMNLFLEIMQSTTPVLSDAVPFIDTLHDPLARAKVTVWDQSEGRWVTSGSDGFDADYNNAPVTVDMTGITDERYLFYRWRTLSNSAAQWHSVMFPNSKPVDTLLTLTPEGVIHFTILDLVDGYKFEISPMKYVLAVIDELNTQYPVTSEMVAYDPETDITTVDLSSIKEARNIEHIEGTWKVVINVGAADTVIEGDHTHLNKGIIDLITIDLLGNITIDGVVLVSAEDRNTSRYLIDPGLFPETTAEVTTLLVDPSTFSISTDRVDPGEYSAVKVSMYRDAGVYNSSMTSRILNPSSYGTFVSTVDSELS
jgi:hypothetical protein